ncbi:hypothetical protein U1Q18_021051 [Sarracenia purpurea var. burkii]
MPFYSTGTAVAGVGLIKNKVVVVDYGVTGLHVVEESGDGLVHWRSDFDEDDDGFGAT